MNADEEIDTSDIPECGDEFFRRAQLILPTPRWLEPAKRIELRRHWNPRYLNYCRVHGRQWRPEDQIAADRERWPGGCMAGFLLWIDQRWREWRWAHGIGPDDVLDGHDHKAFDRWLDAWTPFGP